MYKNLHVTRDVLDNRMHDIMSRQMSVGRRGPAQLQVEVRVVDPVLLEDAIAEYSSGAMRACRHWDGISDEVWIVKQLTEISFGDDRIILESHLVKSAILPGSCAFALSAL
ncbi:MAG: hypothetical protein HYR60_30035 [Acidobacteria bacterium]|nr:hypothetical protein [Acidobacteriota bacterium]